MSLQFLEQLSACGRRRRGFCLSLVDVMTIAIGVVATISLQPITGTIVIIIPMTLAHFFLFCNVIRLRRNYELIWAFCFVVNVSLWSLFGDVEWYKVLATQTPLTCTLVVLECRSPRYHGIFSALQTSEHPANV